MQKIKHDEVEIYHGKPMVPNLAAKRRLDYDGFPLHLNRLKVAVAYACTVIGSNYKQSKGKTQ